MNINHNHNQNNLPSDDTGAEKEAGFRFEDPIWQDVESLKSLVPRLERLECGRVLRILTNFGHASTTLVPVHWGTKIPAFKRWQHLTPMDLNDDGFVRLLEKSNIAILTGPASDGLVSIDFDDEAAFEQFRSLNPELCETTRITRGARGCNLWMKLETGYPVGPQSFHDENGSALGEFRAGGAITVVDGLHPLGMLYSTKGQALANGDFSMIRWPESWRLPWTTPTADDYERLVGEFGEPFSETRNSVQINQPFFVGRFRAENIMLHDPALGFFRYCADDGVWHPVTGDLLKHEFSASLKTAADEAERPEINSRRNDNLLRSLVAQLKGLTEQRDAFHRTEVGVIHTESEMIRLVHGQRERLPFHPSYRSLARIPIHYNPEARCPRFVNELLLACLEREDLPLLQKLLGSFLLGSNPAHKVVIFEGPGGTGKSQLARIVDLVLGERSVAELRTEHLDGRFEMAAYVGKYLLAGRDVPGDFLARKGARFLKKLTGGDLLTIELKGVDARGELRGDFNILITTNARLSIALDGDVEAWKRRIVLFSFKRRGERRAIPNFAERLFQEESEGILNWFIEGAEAYLSDLSAHGELIMTAPQLQRRDELLYESDSVALFVKERLVAAPGSKISTWRMFPEYLDYCLERDLEEVAHVAFARRVGGHIQELHGGKSSENVMENGNRTRGYLGVDFRHNLPIHTGHTD
jgi:P4 family phage/plasmid primase-like protien